MELDFSHQAHFIVALAPEIILSVWAIVILLVGVSPHRSDATGESVVLIIIVDLIFTFVFYAVGLT